MTNIIRILGQADGRSLVLLDELAAGTDPAEGSALARAILLRLLEASALTIATTHHGELKAFAHGQGGVMNASVEFNPETLSPTYHLTIGLPGRSNALEIAQRIGMPRDVIAEARASIGPEQRQVDDLLTDIRREREDAVSSRRAEDVARREAEEIRANLAVKLDAIEDERHRLLQTAREDIERDVQRARAFIADAQQEVEAHKLDAAEARVREAEQQATQVAERAAQAERARPKRTRRPAPAEAAHPPGPKPEDIREGDLVWIRGMERPAEALGEPDARRELEVSLGSLHSRVKLGQVERVQRVAATPDAPAASYARADSAALPIVGMEFDMRGQTVDEAMPGIEQYLDDAFRAGLPRARIIHGKGTGTLRRHVRDLLAHHPLVTSYEEALREEGGEGVTIVHIAV